MTRIKRRKPYKEYRPKGRRKNRDLIYFKGNTGVKIVVCAMIIVASLFVKNSTDPFFAKIKEGLEKSINASITPEDVAVFFQGVGNTYDSFKEQAKAVFAPISGSSTKNTIQPESFVAEEKSLQDRTKPLITELPSITEDKSEIEPIKVIPTKFDSLPSDDNALEDFDSNEVRTDMPAKVETKLLSVPFSLILPVKGEITSPFGMRVNPITNKNAFHYGVDIAAPLGTNVSAVCNGTVKEIGKNSVYGNYIVLTHGEGYETFYAHLSKVNVKDGNKVGQGDKIGKVGATGWATGSHLHFEFRYDDKILCPTDYFAF